MRAVMCAGELLPGPSERYSVCVVRPPDGRGVEEETGRVARGGGVGRKQRIGY